MAEDFPDGIFRELVLCAASEDDLSGLILRPADQEARTARPERAAENGDH